jgi:hypothetical protein
MRRFQHSLTPVLTISGPGDSLADSDQAVTDGEMVFVRSTRQVFAYENPAAHAADGVLVVQSNFGAGVWVYVGVAGAIPGSYAAEYVTASAGALGSGRLLDVTATFLTLIADGEKVWVRSVRDSYTWYATRTDVADGLLIVNPTSNGVNPGRFIRDQVASSTWLTQTAWYIDPSSGTANDENTGLAAGTQLSSMAEYLRRVPKGSLIPALQTIHLVSGAGSPATLVYTTVTPDSETTTAYVPTNPATWAVPAIGQVTVGSDAVRSGRIVVKDSTSTTEIDRIVPFSEKTIMCLGDSTTQGTNSPPSIVACYRIGLWKQLSETRGDDFTSIGDARDAFASIPSLGDWSHAGYSGATTQYIDGHIGALFASVGTPDTVVLSAGINNIVLSAENLATLQANWTTLMVDLKALMPIGQIVVWPPTLKLGSGASAPQVAECDSFRAWLPTVAAAQGFTFAPVTLSAGDMQLDGRHPNVWGHGRIACSVQRQVDVALGSLSGRTIPRTVLKQPQRYYLYIANWAPNRMEITAGAGSKITPGSGSYAAFMTICPIDLDPGGGYRAMLAYGTIGATGWTFGSVGGKLQLYFGNNAGPFVTGTTEPWCNALLRNRFARVGFIVSGGLASLYVNGQHLGTTAQVAYNIGDNAILYVGGGATYTGMAGYYGDLRIYRGSGVPVAGTRAALRAAEEEYYDQASLCPGCDTYYSMNNTSAAGVYGDAAGTPVSATYETVVHAPWEYPDVATVEQVAGVLPVNATSALPLDQLLVTELESSGNASGTVTITAVIPIPGMQWVCRNNNTGSSTTTFFGITVGQGKSALVRINSAGAGERVTPDT